MSIEAQIAVLGGGCFWCLEAAYLKLKGVVSAVSGYTGGHTADPNYDDVCSGRTGHAEVVRVEFDPSIIDYSTILEVFWKIHDPTTLNRQGNDKGTQYRSAIFYSDEKQKKLAMDSREKAENAKIWPNPVVTEILSLDIFYPAEDYHDNYYERNRASNPYCIYVIDPKIKKLKESFPHLLV